MQIGRFFGIPIRVDWSWLLVFALLVWSLSGELGPFGSIPARLRPAAAVLTVLTFFACVVAHELGHALAAQRYGIRTRDVVLFVFGGVSRMDRVGISAGSEALIALAGPAVTFALSAAFAALAVGTSDQALVRVFVYLAVVNVTVGVFNLLPAYPLDGGRVVHAVAWRLTNDRLRATKIAAGISFGAGLLLAAGGVVLVLTGFAISGTWIVLIAWFILRMGRAELFSETAIEPLRKLHCSDVAEPAEAPIEPDAKCDWALDVMTSSGRRFAAVTVGKRFLGTLALSDFSKLAGLDASRIYVAAIMTPADQLPKVAPDASALEAFRQLSASGLRELPVVTPAGELTGFVTGESIRRAAVRV